MAVTEISKRDNIGVIVSLFLVHLWDRFQMDQFLMKYLGIKNEYILALSFLVAIIIVNLAIAPIAYKNSKK